MGYNPRAVSSDALARAIEFDRARPLPPREVRLENGKLTWSPPSNTNGITHYNIYAENESSLVEQVPAGQYVLRSTLSAKQVLVSSWNAALQTESPLVLLQQVVSGGTVDLDSISLTISSVSAAYLSTPTSNGVIKLVVTINGTATGTGFDRVAVYLRTPLESDPTPLEPEPDGLVKPIGEYTGLSSPWTVKLELDPPSRQEGWRFYVTQGSKDGTAPLTAGAVTYLLIVDPIPSGAGGSEWAPSVSAFTSTVEYAEAETGGQVWRVFGTFTSPTDEKYRGVDIIGRDPAGKDTRLSFVPRGTNGYVSDYYAVPLSSQNWTIYARSVGPNARTNNIVPGTTPSVAVTVQRQAGGGLRLNVVNAATLDLTEFQISSGALRMNQINASKILTGILSVGGGGSKPGQMAVFNGAGVPIGWIGEQGVLYGAWFAQLWVGGNGPSSAPLFVDGVGNVRIDNSGLAQEATFKLVKGGTDTRLQNTDINAFGAVYGLDVRATTGSPLLRAAISPYGLDCYSGASLSTYMDQAGYHMSVGGLLREWRRSDGVINASGVEIGGSTALTSLRQAILADLTVGGGVGSFNTSGQLFCTKVNVNGTDRITTFGDVYGQEVHSGSAFFVNNIQVVGPRAGAISNPASIPGTGSAGADHATGSLFSALVDLQSKVSTILSMLRTHGLIAP